MSSLLQILAGSSGEGTYRRYPENPIFPAIFLIALFLLPNMIIAEERKPQEAQFLSPATVILSWNDVYKLFPEGNGRMAQEVVRIFGEIGVNVRWEEKASSEFSSPDTIRVRVVLRPKESSQWGLPQNTMGVVIGEKIPRESVYIFYNNVIRTIGYDLGTASSRSPKVRAQVTRAMARVVAHEIIHALIPEREHDSSGLMSLNLNRRLLLKRRLLPASPTSPALLGSPLPP